ncbi:outer membrane protein [Xylanibacter oryzae DSM 17970]|uniref:Outer membrane protein n=1 Tax=Xylanibacter oryzae DSM 17970 TaxID=915438 RepID=A0ABN0RTY5_9BACT|nr:outer membrane protein [Xylanibacter oryzae DSM 17970]
MKKLIFLISFFLMLMQTKAKAIDNNIKLTLPEAIAMARTQSVDAVVARGELKSAYWAYRTYQADLLPELSFDGTVPQYNKSYSSYQQDDGSYKFIRNNWFGMNGALNVNQNIWLTGGSLSLTTSLDYIKADGMKNFMSVPISLTLNQPIFGVNDSKWKRRIEPVKYREAKAAFITATEEVTMKTIQYFFNLLLAHENVSIAQQNLKNATRLYDIAEARKKMGQVSESDMLRLKLSALNAQSTLTSNESSLNSNMFQLKTFLNISDSTLVDLVIPENMPGMTIRYADVLDKALENNSFALNIRRRQLESDYAVAKAKGDLRSIKLTASVGYSGIGNDKLSYAYNALKNNTIVSVGFSIPILDWGKRRGEVKVAESNREITESKIRQEQQTFNQDIFLLVEHFNNQSKQLNIATEADSIAQRRYKTSIETFMIGKINTLDLNDAQVNKDESRQKNISELFYYWYYYYQLRSLTLWDFAKNKGIDADFDEIIKR